MELDTYTVDGVTYTEFGDVVETTAGPYCGCCNRGGRKVSKIRHANAASIKACYANQAAREADAEAEIQAEAAQLRHLENAGYDEARAQEDWEWRMGVRDPQWEMV